MKQVKHMGNKKAQKQAKAQEKKQVKKLGNVKYLKALKTLVPLKGIKKRYSFKTLVNQLMAKSKKLNETNNKLVTFKKANKVELLDIYESLRQKSYDKAIKDMAKKNKETLSKKISQVEKDVLPQYVGTFAKPIEKYFIYMNALTSLDYTLTLMGNDMKARQVNEIIIMNVLSQYKTLIKKSLTSIKKAYTMEVETIASKLVVNNKNDRVVLALLKQKNKKGYNVENLLDSFLSILSNNKTKEFAISLQKFMKQYEIVNYENFNGREIVFRNLLNSNGLTYYKKNGLLSKEQALQKSNYIAIDTKTELVLKALGYKITKY